MEKKREVSDDERERESFPTSIDTVAQNRECRSNSNEDEEESKSEEEEEGLIL